MPRVHRGPLGHEAGLLLGVAGQQRRAAGPLGQQQPGLLEGLADDGHPVGQAARVDPEQALASASVRPEQAASASAPPSARSTEPPGKT